MIRTNRWFVIATLALATTGCGLFRLGKGPPLERYRLEIPRPGADGGGSAQGIPVLQGSMAITPYEAPGMYGRDPIVFRINNTQLGTYPNKSWAIPLREQLGLLTAAVLETRPLTSQRAQFDPPSRRGNTYMWRGSIREFEEVNRGDTVLAAVAIDVQLLRTADDSIIWSGSQRLERVVPPPNTTMEPIVQVLSELAVEVVENLIDGARVALRTAPVDSARSPR